MQTDLVTFENREAHLPALALLAESLQRHAGDARLHLPARFLPQSSRELLGRWSNVVLHADLWAEDESWNIKPFLLQHFLASGMARVTWIDADILVTSDPGRHLAALAPDEMLVAEEGYRSRFGGTVRRTDALGLPRGRDLGYTVNSCVVSVTPAHLPLLACWKGVLRSSLYLDQQNTDWQSRSPFLMGDQDVLGGLLGSADFAGVRVTRLRNGVDIAHDMLPGDYGVLARLATVRRGEPCFIHAQGRKAWLLPADAPEARSLGNQLSVYRHSARPFAGALPDRMTGWIKADGRAARISRRLFPHRPSLRGLMIGMRGSLLNGAYRTRNLFRRNGGFATTNDQMRPAPAVMPGRDPHPNTLTEPSHRAPVSADDKE